MRRRSRNRRQRSRRRRGGRQRITESRLRQIIREEVELQTIKDRIERLFSPRYYDTEVRDLGSEVEITLDKTRNGGAFDENMIGTTVHQQLGAKGGIKSSEFIDKVPGERFKYRIVKLTFDKDQIPAVKPNSYYEQ